ncbi:SpoIIE family protein phosphatase [Nocardioides sp. BP30]|uniref:PP2C family protein-serine/threonine phosphatase n=1 Tax=Nocardioides sp. BP30 TaxID=3036374 RepID=UPI00246934D4|nr:SpoIIE family protein phosphatase [Nocardioides sp. BP30]WGL51654.1 SpoIIE family protein phosphatase [Nocardioides sp. BP30]
MEPAHGTADPFERAPCGYVVTDGEGVIVRANAEFLRMVEVTAAEIVSVRTLASFVSVAGRILLETHLFPMLEHSRVIREIDLDLVTAGGRRVPVLFNAGLASPGGDRSVLAVFVEARDRHRYEEDLRHAKRTADHAREEAAALAETLQQTLIPPAPPHIPGLDIAAAYRPAGAGREVGGDFYDVFQVSASAWIVALGDVSGKGVSAATVTSLVRYTVRSFAIDHPDPADLLGRVDAVLSANDTRHYCTLVVARLERHGDGWELALSLAGQPAALLRSSGGEVSELGVFGTPVGLVEHPRFTTVRHRLRAGSSVTLFTDGVTEGRGADGMYGDERLHDLVRDLPADVQAVTDGIARAVLEFQNGDASDDIAIVTFAPQP